MNDEARQALSDMFPDIPERTLASILQSSRGNFSAAVDEALTFASLGDAIERAQIRADYFAPPDVTVERWEDASSFFPDTTTPTLAPETSARTVSSPTGYETAFETRLPSSTAGFSPTSAGAASGTPGAGDHESQRLPWEGKETRYVIGSGELGLLNELQMPRTGAAIPVAHEFLSVPPRSIDIADDPGKPPLAAAKPRNAHDDEGRACESATTANPDVTSALSSAIWKRKGRDNGVDWMPDDRAPCPRPASANFRRPLSLEEDPPVRIADALAETHVTGENDDEQDGVGRVRGEAGRVSRGSSREPENASAVTKSFARVGGVRGGRLSSTSRRIETASAAERIAAFRPGTRFRVAVDKGVTGLGITVKEIRGRFFVYKLQTLADGSPGAAEEAGVKAGDQLLGVEELDFETERWDMDQLVSYMGELMGVVILHMMRGFGPLPQAPKGDLENGMSYGVARAEKTTAGGTVEKKVDEGGERGLETVESRARRLLDVLEEEELLKPSEAANVSRLYCQITERARQWDTGELWLSATDLSRRPSRGTLAEMAQQWQPNPPPGWEESDSSDGESSPPLAGGQWSSGGRNTPANHTCPRDPKPQMDSHVPGDGDDLSADLDKIGTDLLGQPMFGEPTRARTVAAAAVAASSSREGKNHDGGGRFWSPWPQLVALESKAARHSTVVPTRGLRKALNVRLLEQTPSSELAAAGGTNPGSRDTATSRGVSYLVWVMDVESGAEWRVRRYHSEFAELHDACAGMRPSLARLDFPPWIPDVKETPGVVEARRPRLEAYLQRLCSLLYMGPLHPSSTNLAHLLQDFLGTSPRVETLGRLQKSRPERELRQALQVRTWQVFRLPPLERAVNDFVREVCDPASSRSKKPLPADAVLKRLMEVIEHLQFVVTEGCFDELREMVRLSGASKAAARVSSYRGSEGAEGGVGAEERKDDDHSAELERLAEEDEALELISGSVRRQVEAEVFVPVMTRIYRMLRTEGATARLEKAVSLSVAEARGKPQSFHGIPIANLSPSSWNSSVKLLQTVGLFTLPCDKLDALMAVAHDIPALHRMEHPGDNTNGLGADDFLPIFIYVLVNSGVQNLAAQSVVLETLCDPTKMMGEAGFCVATLSAALQHLGRQAEGRTSKGSISSFLGRRNQLTV